MILRKTPSAFLRALRSIPADKLPPLPEKPLSERQYRRLEASVFARIAADERRTVFDALPDDGQMTLPPVEQTGVRDASDADSPYEAVPVGGAWKRGFAAVLAACLCFAVLTTAVLFRADIASFLTGHLLTPGTEEVTGHENTQAIHRWEEDERLTVPPENAADALSMQVIRHSAEENRLTLTLRLTAQKDGLRWEGTAIQYNRIQLETWDSDVGAWQTVYEDTLSYQPVAQILAGDIHANIIGLGSVTEAEMTLTLPVDLRDAPGVWRVSLDGLTLVRDAKPDETGAQAGLIAEPLCDGIAWALFSTEEPQNVPSDGDELSETGVEPPYESAAGYRLEVQNADVLSGRMALDVLLTSDTPMSGISVQYRRVMLTRWNRETEQHEVLYDTITSDQPKLDVLAGEIDLRLPSTGETNHVDGEVTVFGNYTGQPGLYHLVLEGLTLVSEVPDAPIDGGADSLAAASLTDGCVVGSFVIFPDTAPPPMPADTAPPADASARHSLTVTAAEFHDDAVRLDLQLTSSDGFPVGTAIYYSACTLEHWGGESGVWEEVFTDDFTDIGFDRMLMAGELHFWLGTEYEPTESATSSLSASAPEVGWYRITLRGLVLVREAREGEVSESHLITEPLDDGAVWAMFYRG